MKSNVEWKLWGRVDPLWAVASWSNKQKGGPAPWTDHEFYSTGRSDWEDFLEQWSTYGVNTAHCLEIGCGAGRLTKHIASSFTTVSATDVSLHQIEYASSRIEHCNVTFILSDGVRVPEYVGNVTAVFSAHVFQHFDSYEDAKRLLKTVTERLMPSGTMMIHLPVYELPGGRIRPILQSLVAIAVGASRCQAWCYRRVGRLFMRGLHYERRWVVETLHSLGMRKIVFRTFSVRSNGESHTFVFARKGESHRSK